MTVTFSSTSQRITISGTYKTFTVGSGSTTDVVQYSTGDAPASGDAGRFLMWKNGTNTADWEIRFIESATATAVTVGDGGLSAAPSVGDTVVISTSLADIDNAYSDTIVRRENRSFQIRGRDFELTNGAFVADVDASLSTESTQTGSGFIGTYPVADGCALQFGRLIGGEANDSIETIGGCQITFEIANNTTIFTTQNSQNTNGPILNFYGCLLESIDNGFSPFIRAPGPMRLIGCVVDGAMGGRLYNEGSELVSTRFSGNLSGGQAWSLGASFTRPIADAFFFQNNTAIKAFQSFSGAFTDCTFADSNTDIINADSARSGLLFTFTDCTTFADGAINANKGQYEQAKSIKYQITDSTGTGLTGALVAVYDTDNAIQTGIQTSTAGAVPQINARFFRKDHGSAAVTKSPFTIRIRKYGYTYLGFSSTVADKIDQEVRLTDNTSLVSTEAQAAAITGISLDFSTETVTITEDTTTQRLYDYYQYQLAQSANMAYGEDLVRSGDSFDLDDWDMTVDGCTYTGDATTTGVITLVNGATFTGTRTDQNGTVLPLRNVSITGLAAGSRIQVYNETTSTEVVNQIVASTSYTATYAEGVGYSAGDTLRIRATQTNGTTAKLPYVAAAVVASTGWSLLVSQEDDTVYNTFGVDGSTVTTFTADYVNDQVDVVVGSNFNMSDFYPWWAYNLTTEQGIREFFGGLIARDQANFEILTDTLSLFLDNTTTTNIRQLDNRRIYRTDGTYPVLDPTTGGGGIDVVWRNTILIDTADVSSLRQLIRANQDITSTSGKLKVRNPDDDTVLDTYTLTDTNGDTFDPTRNFGIGRRTLDT